MGGEKGGDATNPASGADCPGGGRGCGTNVWSKMKEKNCRRRAKGFIRVIPIHLLSVGNCLGSRGRRKVNGGSH